MSEPTELGDRDGCGQRRRRRRSDPLLDNDVRKRSRGVGDDADGNARVASPIVPTTADRTCVATLGPGDSTLTGDPRRLNEREYARYLRRDTPHVRQHLAQWNALYRRYEADVCEAEQSRAFGSANALRGANISDIATIATTGRYTACVNVPPFGPDESDGDRGTVHVCNFLPVVTGTLLDRRLRRIHDDDHDRYGEVYMFNMFWVFNSYLCTDSKLFHEYRSHRRAADDDSGEDHLEAASIRAYVYDRNGKGHMLFTRNKCELWLRDCHKREVRLVDATGRVEAYDETGASGETAEAGASGETAEAGASGGDVASETVAFFVENALRPHPCFADESLRSPARLFRDIRDYMLRGVANEPSQSDASSEFGYSNRRIDDLENKRIASAPGLYVNILEAMQRTLRDIVLQREPAAATAAAVARCVTKYADAAHRGDLRQYISRKTAIRMDWSDYMKRQVKMDMRRKRATATTGVTAFAAATIVASGASAIRIRAPDVTQNARFSQQNQQQFLCAKIHDCTEYDYEQVKRMRVVNINSTKNLGLPERSERFFSPCNTGSISKAGRVLNRTHVARESFFVDPQATVRSVTRALHRYFESCVVRDDDADTAPMALLAVNEIPIARLRIRPNSALAYAAGDAASFWRFFRTVKRFAPMCCVNAVRLRGSNPPDMFLNVRVANGIPMVPVTVLDAQQPTKPGNGFAAEYCRACDDVRPIVTSARFEFTVSPPPKRDDGGTCTRHIWCSRRELDLYEQASGASLADPLYHEMSCHGALVVASYQRVTDISKLIVGINAYKRSLGAVDATRNESMLRRALANSDVNGRRSWLRVRSPRYIDSEKRMLRLFFAFGDFGMRNCEDGYVIARDVPFTVDSVFCCRFGVNGTGGVSFLASPRLEYPLDHGASLYLGTFRSWAPINFSPNNAILVRLRRRRRDDAEYAYDVHFVSNASFLQIPAPPANTGNAGAACRFRTSHRSHEPVETKPGGCHGAVFTARYVFRQRCGDCEYAAGADASCQAVREVLLDVYDKMVRLKVCVTDTRQTVKLQNSFGQKGVAQYADLSDLVTERGEPVHIVASMYSLIGRNACGQLLEQCNDEPAKVYSRSSGKLLGYGGYGRFFVSDDSPHANFIYSVRREGANPIRMCRLTYESLLENNVSSAAFVKASEFESGANNPYAGMPRNVSSALRCYNMYDREISMVSQRALTLRRRVFDATVIDEILRDRDDEGGNE